ncbi:hypothetical protein GGF46_000474 [Coemansia sp. RSA 552]|nr:hypothetical protein GGF46_000474 [Coemansia sp. RSA 552]
MATDAGTGDSVREKHLRRALSILLRTAKFDAATSNSLDLLCSVAVLYMQNMFSHVHTYAEHATRTRPNMNDVGRALEERAVSTKQLYEYYQREKDARSQPPIDAAVAQLHNQASILDVSDIEAAHSQNSTAAFSDRRAEDLLCRLVGFSKEREDARRAEKHKAQEGGEAQDMGSTAGSGLRDGDRHGYTAAGAAGGGDIDADEDDAEFEAPDMGGMHSLFDGPRGPDAAPDTEEDTQRADSASEQADEPADQQQEAPDNEAETSQMLPPPDAIETMLLPLAKLPEHIPAQFPPFPSPHTYRQTPVYPKREQDFFRTRMHKAEQSRQAEENLQRLISRSHAHQSGQAEPSAGGDAQADVHSSKGLSSSDDGLSAQKRILDLFPPANFRDAPKRTRLADLIK